MSCHRCKTSPGMREAWGCERDAKEPVAKIDCTLCSGQDETCTTCSGTGTESIYRCPRMTVPPLYGRIVEMCLWAEKGLGLPEGGGQMDQTAWWWAAMGRVISEVQEWRDRKPPGTPNGSG